MKIQTKSEREMGERGWVRKREGGKKVGERGLAKRGRGPAPGMCLGPRNMGIRPCMVHRDSALVFAIRRCIKSKLLNSNF